MNGSDAPAHSVSFVEKATVSARVEHEMSVKGIRVSGFVRLPPEQRSQVTFWAGVVALLHPQMAGYGLVVMSVHSVPFTVMICELNSPHVKPPGRTVSGRSGSLPSAHNVQEGWNPGHSQNTCKKSSSLLTASLQETGSSGVRPTSSSEQVSDDSGRGPPTSETGLPSGQMVQFPVLTLPVVFRGTQSPHAALSCAWNVVLQDAGSVMKSC